MKQLTSFESGATVDVDKLVSLLGNAYSTLINNKKPIAVFPSVMLWGQPGVGKSQAIRQIATLIEEKTGKHVNVTDVRLLLFNPIDLRGIPVADAQRQLAVWLKPKIFDMDHSDATINILLLDEISAAPQSVQAAAYQITLDRKVGEHLLPDNCIVIAAGNRITDKSVAYKMPKALANRLLHFNIESKFKSWKAWAVRNDIHPMVIGFLNFKSEDLNKFDPDREDLAFATPRSWEMVSNLLNNITDNINDIYPLIRGLVGTGVAAEFKTFANLYNRLPEIKDIFDGTVFDIPDDPSVIYALCSAMVSYVKNNQDDLRGIANSIEYMRNMPRDFAIMLIQDYQLISEKFAQKVRKMPEFAKLVHDNASFLNGMNNEYN